MVHEEKKQLIDKRFYTINDAIEHAGFGVFQVFLLFVTGIVWMADAMEVMLVSFVIPILSKEWNLDDITQKPLLGSSIFLGMLIGASLWGQISDKWGRKRTVLSVCLFTGIFGIGSAFSSNWILFLFLRTLTGVGAAGGHVPFSLLSEFLSANLRGQFLLYIEVFWTIGAIFESGLAWALLPIKTLPMAGYEVGTWRILLVISSIPMFFVILFLPFMPESPRYLFVTKKYEAAEQVLTRMIYWNCKTALKGRLKRPEDFEDEINTDKISINNITVEKKVGSSPIERFKLLFSIHYWKITLLLLGIWFVNSFCYYGVVVMTPTFFHAGGNNIAYVEVFITSAAEFPGVLVAALLINSIGRKKTQGFLFLFCGIFMLLLMIPTAKWLLTVFAVGTRLCIMGAFSTTFVFTPEVFPTVIRSTGLGLCSSFSKLAGVITPFVGTALFKLNAWIPLIIYGAACIIGSIMTFMVPIETAGKNLADH